jgi:hypothetical protein
MKVTKLTLYLMAVTTVVLSVIAVPVIQYTYAQTTNNGISILSHSSYLGDLGDFHVIGEVQNNAVNPMEFVEITATFYDAAGKVVGTGSGYTDMEILRPAETSSFEILLTEEEQSKKIDNYELSVSGDETFEPKPANLKLNVGDSFTDSIDTYHIVGEVTNQGDQITKFVEVAGAFYNDQNQVVAVGFSYTDPSDLSPGATAPFEILVSAPNVDQITSARLNVQSEDYSMVATTESQPVPVQSENSSGNEQEEEEESTEEK